MVSTKPGELCFFGEQSFLSNFYLMDTKHRGRVYKTAEHLFQAAMCEREFVMQQHRKLLKSLEDLSKYGPIGKKKKSL